MAEKVIPFDPEGGLIEQLLNLPIKRNGIYPLRYDEQRRGLVKAREVEGEREYPYDTVAIVKGKDGILATEPWAVRAKRYHDCPFVSIECCDNGTKRVHLKLELQILGLFLRKAMMEKLYLKVDCGYQFWMD